MENKYRCICQFLEYVLHQSKPTDNVVYEECQQTTTVYEQL